MTKNEEKNLSSCLASVAWCDDVVVLDSFSSDSTEVIARACGVRFIQREFDNFSGQRNYALTNISFKYPWVFHLDADEHFTNKLRDECIKHIQQDLYSGFLVPNKLIFMGRWLKYSGMYPTYQVRLLKIKEIQFVQYGHGQREYGAVRGIGKINEPYIHYNFSKGLSDWWKRHNRYALQEAQQAFEEDTLDTSHFLKFFSRDSIVRRRALKSFSYSLPFRPVLRFIYNYFFKYGFLDGYPGFRYSVLLAIYESRVSRNLKVLRYVKKLP